jgi:hypothetical protein
MGPLLPYSRTNTGNTNKVFEKEIPGLEAIPKISTLFESAFIRKFKIK